MEGFLATEAHWGFFSAFYKQWGLQCFITMKLKSAELITNLSPTPSAIFIYKHCQWLVYLILFPREIKHYYELHCKIPVHLMGNHDEFSFTLRQNLNSVLPKRATEMWSFLLFFFQNPCAEVAEDQNSTLYNVSEIVHEL